ncbi:hypothetical protein [Chryseobacterium luquanense]|uniref:DUF4352 domain-containing protein n=1 Tax=Chryseobacterium luquanense TaxID=2983766 RepID=A0ABT3Y863_9FLAO|nr:hypothetical protein [Chryseobacterium luquanense]MCX8534360.1 hypothetical protein [Chryseobacterium luquanense]
MGIVALVLIVIIILIFFILKIPKLNVAKKILIVISVLLLCITTLAVIFITGFDRGRMPKREEVEEGQKNFDTIKKSDSTITKVYENLPKDNSEQIKALLFNIEGNYEFKKEETTCKMNLTLYYQKNQLKYKLKTNTREFSDNAEIELNEKKDGYYITFKNIEWSEYLGGLDNEGEPIDKNLSIPENVSGTLYKNEIIIQNYGNSMNYYVVFDDCGEKYIELIKK